MSEKRKIQRFNLDEGRIWEAIEGLSPFKTTYTLEEVCEKLNEQQSIINKLKSDIEETEISIKLFEDDIATKDKKIEEQQATIKDLKRKLQLYSAHLYGQIRKIIKEMANE